jgi:hypothetical protein
VTSPTTGSQRSPKASPSGSAGGGGSGGGGVDTGGGSTDTGGDTEAPVDENLLFKLDPGCAIPVNVRFAPTAVGDVYGAIVIESVQQAESGNDLPAYLRDPLHWKQMVYLHGEASSEQGALVVRPRAHDFGYVHPDDAVNIEPARVEVANEGEGEITLTSVGLAPGCDPAFSLDYSLTANTVLEGGESTLVEVAFAPLDTDPAYCQVLLTTDDPANPEIDITVSGNTGNDPKNVPPTVFIRQPSNGWRYNAIRPLRMELNIFDVNQPASSLVCKVRSATKRGISTCPAGGCQSSARHAGWVDNRRASCDGVS